MSLRPIIDDYIIVGKGPESMTQEEKLREQGVFVQGRLDIFQHIGGYYLGREIYICVIRSGRAGSSHKN